MIQKILGEPVSSDAELDLLFASNQERNDWRDNNQCQPWVKCLWTSRTLQTGFKPRVNHPWPTWLPSKVKWLDLWTGGDQWCHLSHLKQGFQNWLPKIPCTPLGILQSRWVDSQLGKNLVLDDGAQKETANNRLCSPAGHYQMECCGSL